MPVKEDVTEERTFVKWFSELSKKDVDNAGVKGAYISEMYNNSLPVPPGFVVTVDAVDFFMEKSGLKDKVLILLNNLDVNNTKSLMNTSRSVSDLIEESILPKEISEAIREAYEVLDVDRKNTESAVGGALDILTTSYEPPFVAVRASLTGNPYNASFAGQQESYLYIKGEEKLNEAIKKVVAGFYNESSMIYRKRGNLDDARMAIVVQRMIDPDKSGIIFSRNPISNDGNIVIESVFGLGSGIVSGRVSPDNYVVNSEFELVRKKVSEKKYAFVRNSSGVIEKVSLNHERRNQEVLTGHEIKIVSQLAMQIESIFDAPQNIEFAIDGGKVYFLQSRPITSEIKVSKGEVEGSTLLEGVAASGGVASGNVRVIRSAEDITNLARGDVVVCDFIEAKMLPKLKEAAAIISEEGGMTSQSAIIAREMDMPYVSNVPNALEKLQDNQRITVNGFSGRIIEGVLKGEMEDIELPSNDVTKTKEVRLVRIERLIAESGKHAAWYLKHNKSGELVSLIKEKIKEIVDEREGIWVRTSSFRSDDSENLEESPRKEANPSLGHHGIRYGLKNQDLIVAEFRAIKDVADDFPNKEIGVILSRVISVNEIEEAKKLLEEVHIPANVKVGVMIETPAAVHIIDEICDRGIDFICLGMEDLTEHILSVDRRNENVNELFDMMNPAVKRAVSGVISSCKKHNVKTSAFGNFQSEMALFLIDQGVDVFSVESDIDSVKEYKGGVSEEDLILKALDDDYNPGIGSDKEIPSLNEAIPVDSEDFRVEEEKVRLESEERNFENQQDVELDKDIVKEATEFEEYQQAQEEKKKGGNQEEQVLDIF